MAAPVKTDHVREETMSKCKGFCYGFDPYLVFAQSFVLGHALCALIGPQLSSRAKIVIKNEKSAKIRDRKSLSKSQERVSTHIQPKQFVDTLIVIGDGGVSNVLKVKRPQHQKQSRSEKGSSHPLLQVNPKANKAQGSSSTISSASATVVTTHKAENALPIQKLLLVNRSLSLGKLGHIDRLSFDYKARSRKKGIQKNGASKRSVKSSRDSTLSMKTAASSGTNASRHAVPPTASTTATSTFSGGYSASQVKKVLVDGDQSVAIENDCIEPFDGSVDDSDCDEKPSNAAEGDFSRNVMDADAGDTGDKNHASSSVLKGKDISKKWARVPCMKCGRKFGRTSLRVHQTLCSLSPEELATKFCCKICGRISNTQRGLSAHMTRFHKMIKSKECNICGETFTKWNQVTKHKLAAHQVKEHSCHICGKTYTEKNSLKIHLEVHTGIKRHTCEYCGKAFLRYTTLCDHKVMVHNAGRDTLQCHRCEETFSSKWHLHQHLARRHSTGPYFEKSKASKTLSEAELYARRQQQAIRRQMKQDDIFCDVCGKTFAFRSLLKVHYVKHNEKSFQCSVCPKRFRSQKYVIEHERVHKQESKLKCEVCGKLISRPRNLKKHMSNLHPNASLS